MPKGRNKLLQFQLHRKKRRQSFARRTFFFYLCAQSFFSLLRGLFTFLLFKHFFCSSSSYPWISNFQLEQNSHFSRSKFIRVFLCHRCYRMAGHSRTVRINARMSSSGIYWKYLYCSSYLVDLWNKFYIF